MIRGIERPIPKVNRTIEASIHNRFDIEVIDVNTGAVRKKVTGYNTICSQLWTKLCAGTPYFKYIQYGGGSGTPSASDTSLFSRIGDSAVTYSTYSMDYKTGVFSLRQYIQLSASTAVGKTITEVGIASASGNGNLCTHAMLQDMNGNRISIEKTDTDIVNIYATVFVHVNPLGYDSGSLRLYCFSYRYSLFGRFAGYDSSEAMPNRAFVSSSYGNYSGGLSGGTHPTNLGDSSSGYVELTNTWDASNKTLTIKLSRLEASTFNIGGIRRICLSNHSGSYYTYNYPLMLIYPGGSWFPHSSIVGEAVGTGDGTTKDFALDFPFAHDLKAYIDGSETTEFSLDYAPKDYGTDSNGYGYSVHMEWLNSNSTPDNHIPYLGNTAGSGAKFNGTRRFYNPAYELGIAQIYKGPYTTISVSNDLSDWITIGAASSSGGTFAVPVEYQHYKYWRGVSTSDSGAFAYTMKPPSTYVGKALHFNSPPPEGAVITADYQSDCIAKDANHVFDLTITIQLGEYVEV